MHERLSFSQVAIVKSVLSTCDPSIVSLGRLQFAVGLDWQPGSASRRSDHHARKVLLQSGRNQESVILI
jgi:hypothetical protein